MLTHSWFMGYAPADDPQVAFAVLVEYGGGGGAAAGSVAKNCSSSASPHGHLKLTTKRRSPRVPGPELLHAAR
jgi:hypothetical protein